MPICSNCRSHVEDDKFDRTTGFCDWCDHECSRYYWAKLRMKMDAIEADASVDSDATGLSDDLFNKARDRFPGV